MTVSFSIPPSPHFQLRTSQRKPMCSPNQPWKILLLGSHRLQHPQAHSLQSGHTWSLEFLSNFPTSCLPLSWRDTRYSSWLPDSKTYISSLCSFSSRLSLLISTFPRPYTTNIMILILLRRTLKLGKVMQFGWVLRAQSTKSTFVFISLWSQDYCSSYSVLTYWVLAGDGACVSLIFASVAQGLTYSECLAQEISLWLLIGLHSESRQCK